MYFTDADDKADGIIDEAKTRLSGSDWDNPYFVGILAQLDSEIYNATFTEVNEGWNHSFGAALNAVYEKPG